MNEGKIKYVNKTLAVAIGSAIEFEKFIIIFRNFCGSDIICLWEACSCLYYRFHFLFSCTRASNQRTVHKK